MGELLPGWRRAGAFSRRGYGGAAGSRGEAVTCCGAEERRDLALVERGKVEDEGPLLLRLEIGEVAAHRRLARAQVPRVLARRGGVREAQQRDVERGRRPPERRQKVGRQLGAGPHVALDEGEHAHEVLRRRLLAVVRHDARDRRAVAVTQRHRHWGRQRGRAFALAGRVLSHMEHGSVLALQLVLGLARVGHLDHVGAALCRRRAKVEVALAGEPRDGGDRQAEALGDEGGDVAVGDARPAQALEVLPGAGVGAHAERAPALLATWRGRRENQHVHVVRVSTERPKFGPAG